MTKIAFESFQRPEILRAPWAGVSNGRVRIAFELEARPNVGTPNVAYLEFAVQGPRDVAGLASTAVVETYPEHDALGVEFAYLCSAELAEPDLPWRYCLAEPDSAGGLKPWIVLLVGTEHELTVHPNGRVTVLQSALQDHPLQDSARWVHLERTTGEPVARLLSPRALVENTLHVAAIVPAFDDEGGQSWDGTEDADLPCFHSWQFETGSRPGFGARVLELKGRKYEAGAGDTRVLYMRVDSAGGEFEAPGALRPPEAVAYPVVPGAILNDVRTLATPPIDPTNREVVGTPTYGAQWFENPLDGYWAEELNEHPAHRLAAGLGAAAAFHFEHLLVQEVRRQAGDFDVADQKLRYLTLGTGTANGLLRHLPEEVNDRLMVLGPALGRIVTDRDESMLDVVTGGTSPVTSAIFSGAAQRALRPATAWGRLSANGTNPKNVFDGVNLCPKGPPHVGTAEATIGGSWDVLAQRIRSGRAVVTSVLQPLLNAFTPVPPTAKNVFDALDRHFNGMRGDWLAFLLLYDALTRSKSPGSLETAAKGITVNPDAQDEPPFDGLGEPRPFPPPCDPVDVPFLIEVLSRAVDPTETGRPTERVLASLDGVGVTDPPTIQPYIKFPMWSFLRDEAPEWLLPGVREIEQHTIAVLKPNPLFIEAFMIGANTRLLEALRRYDFEVSSTVTPIKTFWGRLDPASGEMQPDVSDVQANLQDEHLGEHVLPSAGRAAFVVRSPLFHEYPGTSVYLLDARDGTGPPVFDGFTEADLSLLGAGQGDKRVWPVFQGKLKDIVLLGFNIIPEHLGNYWIVFEEAPRDRRFKSSGGAAANGAAFAAARVVGPYRVLLPVTKLLETT